MMKKSPTRRQFINGLSGLIGKAAVGAVLCGNGIPVALAYVPTADSHLKPGKTLNLLEMQGLKSICAQVIPATDTPSAADEDVHGFIDNQLFHCFRASDHEKVKNILSLVDRRAVSRYNKVFIQLDKSSQFRLLEDLDYGRHEFNESQRQDFKFLKKLICFGYYTSEIGATQELRYSSVPGGYKGSIPYQPGDKNWGSLALWY